MRNVTLLVSSLFLMLAGLNSYAKDGLPFHPDYPQFGTTYFSKNAGGDIENAADLQQLYLLLDKDLKSAHLLVYLIPPTEMPDRATRRRNADFYRAQMHSIVSAMPRGSVVWQQDFASRRVPSFSLRVTKRGVQALVDEPLVKGFLWLGEDEGRPYASLASIADKVDHQAFNNQGYDGRTLLGASAYLLVIDRGFTDISSVDFAFEHSRCISNNSHCNGTTELVSVGGANVAGNGTFSPHGTPIAAIASEVVPNLEIVPYQIAGHGQSGYSYTTNVERAFFLAEDDLIDPGYPLAGISISLGGSLAFASGNCDSFFAAVHDEVDDIVADHKIPVVAAAGNSGNTALTLPACLSNVIAVGSAAVDSSGAMVSTIHPQSNRGTEVTLAGPDGPYSIPGFSGTFSGTSFAAPVVAAAAAAIHIDTPTLTPEEIEDFLRVTGNAATGPGDTLYRVDLADPTPAPQANCWQDFVSGSEAFSWGIIYETISTVLSARRSTGSGWVSVNVNVPGQCIDAVCDSTYELTASNPFGSNLCSVAISCDGGGWTWRPIISTGDEANPIDDPVSPLVPYSPNP